MTPLPGNLLPRLVELGRAAGQAVMAVYEAGRPPEATLKTDASPVTKADLAADQIIREGLARHWPGLPVVSEEGPAGAFHTPASLGVGCFLVDPLDGTREFLARNGEFTVNIAWVVDGQAVAGLVHAPALGETFWGSRDEGAFHQGPGIPPRPIRCRAAPSTQQSWRVLGSRSHSDARTGAWISRLPAEVEFVAAGSSLKFCRLAQGLADLYPRFGPTHHWDTAAGQVVLEAAGGKVLDAAGRPMRYPANDLRGLNPHFVAVGDAELWRRLPAFPP